MANDVLSQSEIDALLNAVAMGETSAEELKKGEEKARIRTYDFKRALRISKDQIRSLIRIHENFARILTNYFSAQLRIYTQISVASVDQLPYEEFIRSIPSMTILNVFDVPELDGKMIMEVNPNIAFVMLDRLLGGNGEIYNKKGDLTEIETKILSNFFEHSIECLSESWESVEIISPMLQELEVNPQFLQLVSPNETVIVITFTTQIGEFSDKINLCFPHVLLEKVMSKLSVHYWIHEKQGDEDEGKTLALKKNIRQTYLSISAELGTTDITISDFLALEIGDVIQLDQRLDAPLKVRVGEESKFYGQIGQTNKKMAVQILEEIKGEDEDDG